MEELSLQAVRKPKAKKTHLTVPGSADTDNRTLCGVAMAAGDYEIVDGPADCQPCLRKKGNRAFISSAYFAQDAGGRLLELSLQQARKSRAGRPAGNPQLTVVADRPGEDPAGGDEPRGVGRTTAIAPTAARTRSKGARAPETGAKPKGGARAKPSAKLVDEDDLTDDELRALGLTALKRVGLAVYQSPGGVLVRLHQDGGTWRIAEVTFDGPVSLTARASGRTTTVIGDLRLEEADGGLRLKLTAGRR